MKYILTQKIKFKGINPEKLYEMYVSAKLHSKACGGEASIKPKVGSRFTAWDGYIEGTNLYFEKGKTIVQSWRSSDFEHEDSDSILVLNFYREGKDGVILMSHAGVPDHQYKALKKGWDDFYWKPWKKFLNI